jgi:serine/threonine-protein kinase
MTTAADDLDRQRRAFALLRDLLDAEPDARESMLAARCGDDTALAADMRALLSAREPALLDHDASALAARLVEQGEMEHEQPAGTLIGAWSIARRIGHGGMGTVYLAERDGDGYRQRGALKLIKRGMDSAAVLARFRRERQILSRLAHPNIARLLDGGVSSDGQPYFVMEFIEGATLRAWLTTAKPGIEQRIAAFLEVCEAVAHAHRHLVVHCDIKPDNVLVAQDGHPRLLDFGIAKLLESDAAAEGTATQRRFVSRAYAAPEQLDGGVATTATDVYQLGVLLFELLTGTRYDATLATGAVSGRLARAQARADAATRQAVPVARLRGDAAVIVARATDADPQRRYATVEALAADVRAWQARRPIAARPDSAGYRLRRFVGRHRVASAAAALALAAILAGSALALWQARKAATEARLARSAQAFLSSVFEANAPDSAAGARVTARELLDRGSERVATELADQPRLRGEMQLTLGTLYAQLGQYAQAEHLLGDAQSTLARFDAGSSAATRAVLERAAVLRELDRLDDAERDLAATMAQSIAPELRSRALIERAQLREKQGRFDDALADARAALQVDSARGNGRAEQARDRQIEALVLARQARFDDAARTFERALADARAVHGNEDTRVALMLNDYGAALVENGRSKEAESMVRAALAIRRQRLGDDHPAVAETEQILGAALRAQGRLDETQTVLEDALRIQRAVFGERNALVANTLNSIGMLAFSRRQPATGERHFREVLQIYRTLGLADTPPSATAANNLATVLLQLGRYDEAEPLMREALQVHLKMVGERHPLVMSDLNTIAQLELRRGRIEAALAEARRAVDIASTDASPVREGAYVRISYAGLLARAGRAQEALAEVDAAIAALEGLAVDEPRLPVARATRAEALRVGGRLDEAHALATRVLVDREQRMPSDIGGLASVHALLARIADARRDVAGARRERDAAHRLAAGMPTPDPYLLREIDRR